MIHLIPAVRKLELTDTKQWLEKYRRKWLEKNKRSELSKIEERFLCCEECP